MAIYDTAEGSMVRHNMEQVLKAGHRAKDLVKQILAFSRKSEQDKKIILMTPIIKEVIKLLRASFFSSGMTLISDGSATAEIL